MSGDYGKVIHIFEDGDLQRRIDTTRNRVIIVDFTATWCGPCRFIAPFFAELSMKYSNADFLKVDVDQCQGAAEIHGVHAMPTFLFFIDGNRVDEVRGADRDKLQYAVSKWTNHLLSVNPPSSKVNEKTFVTDNKKVTAGKLLCCFKELKMNEDSVFFDASGILLRFADNVLRDPSNPKFRAVRLGNDIFQNQLLPVPGAVECLFQMGFQEMDDKLVLPDNASLDILDVMKHTIIDERRQRSQQKNTTNSTDDQESQTTSERNKGACAMPLDSKTCCAEPVTKPRYCSLQWKPRCRTDQEVSFYGRLKNSLQHVFLYENEKLQEMAKERMQLNKLISKAKENCLKSRSSSENSEDYVDEKDCLLLLVLDWFKNRFFSWMNQPRCASCDVNTQGIGGGLPTDEDLKWGAGVVELYRCPNCSRNYRFPRYNHPQKLLDTRTGRCGEWANCFTLCCIAAGFEARHVVDWTDHVWTEVYSEHQKRWLHCDPCENICDKPLLYEAGWGKKLSYVIAFSKEEVVDVSWRYSAKHRELLSRRTEVSENWLCQVVFKLTKELQSELPAGRQKLLSERSVTEHVQLLTEKSSVSKDEQIGRQSGSLAWRQIRGEVGSGEKSKVKEYIFVPTKEEIESGRMRIRYNPAEDKYYRGISDNIDTCECMSGWQSGTFNSESVFRKVEHDWNMVYLARQEGASTGRVTWAFEFDALGCCVDTIDIIASSKTFENGSVRWMLEGKNRKSFSIKPKGNGQYLSTPILRGLRRFSLSTELSGGKGAVAWQHAQLFRENSSDTGVFPLDIIVHFQKCN